MSTVMFNGNSFEELGLILKKAVIPPASEEEINVIAIPDGPVILENTHVRKPLKFPIECDLIRPETLRQIYAMIQNQGWLILPSDPDKYYNAVLRIETAESIIIQYQTITFTATAEPYAYSLDNEMEECEIRDIGWQMSANIINNGTADSEPVFVIETKGQFDMVVNESGMRLAFDASEVPYIVIIDVSKGIVTDAEGTSLLHKVEKDISMFRLQPGENEIRVSKPNVVSLRILKNERYY